MTKYVISGANGFVGRALTAELETQKVDVVRLVRRAGSAGNADELACGENFVDVDRVWPDTLRPDCLIHLAARVHVMRDNVADPLREYRAINVDMTLRLAQAAARAGTRRFVYVSSIKAVGETSTSHALTESDDVHPIDPYGISKREAELALFEFGQCAGMEISIVRPPLVYGPGVGANFLNLMRAVARGWPLPLGAVNAKRSLVAVGNLASAIARCASHPQAAGQIFHVADGQDLTVAELIEGLADALGRRALLVPVPPSLLRLAGRIIGKEDAVQRLVEPLQVDIGKLRTRLGWEPPVSVPEGLAATAAWYRSGFVKSI